MLNKSYQVTRASMSEEMQREALQCVLMYNDKNNIAKYITNMSSLIC